MLNSLRKQSLSTGEALDQRFKELANRYAAILNKDGVRCVAYTDEGVPAFAKASREAKLRAIEFLEMANGVLISAIAEGKSLRDNRYILWRTLTKLRLIPDSVIFDHMGEEDLVEVFSINPPGHIAWNLAMMAATSYTVEQLLCLDWSELGIRSPEIMKICYERTLAIASGVVTKTEPALIPEHILQEQNSAELLTVKLDMKWLSPIKRDGQNVGFISIGGVKIVGSLRK